MCETICSISSYIELLGLLKYLMLAWGAYFALSAINCLCKQRYVMRAKSVGSLGVLSRKPNQVNQIDAFFWRWKRH